MHSSVFIVFYSIFVNVICDKRISPIPFLARLHLSAEELLLYPRRRRPRRRQRPRPQNVRVNVKVIEFQSLCIFSCILTLLIILIKPLTTKAHDRRASSDCVQKTGQGHLQMRVCLDTTDFGIFLFSVCSMCLWVMPYNQCLILYAKIHHFVLQVKLDLTLNYVGMPPTPPASEGRYSFCNIVTLNCFLLTTQAWKGRRPRKSSD